MVNDKYQNYVVMGIFIHIKNTTQIIPIKNSISHWKVDMYFFFSKNSGHFFSPEKKTHKNFTNNKARNVSLRKI